MYIRGLSASAFGMALMLSACVAPPVPVPPDGAPVACTLIGCESQVTFELSVDLAPGTTYEVEACIDGDCASATVEVPQAGLATSGRFTVDAGRDALTLRLPDGDYGGAHGVTLSVAGSDGVLVTVQNEVEFERLQPNGPRCEPVCWQATVRA